MDEWPELQHEPDSPAVGVQTLREILGTTSVRDLVARLPRALQGVVPCVAYGIQIYDEPNQLVRILSIHQTNRPVGAELGVDSAEVQEVVESGYPPSDTPFSLVLETGRPVHIDNLAEEKRFTRILDIWRRSGVLSLAYLPLRLNGTLFGALFFGSERPGAFRAATLDLLQIFADHLALAVRSALNVEQIDRARIELANERDRLRMLLQLAKAIGGTLDTVSLMRSIFFEMRKFFSYDFGSVSRYWAETHDLELLYVDQPHDQPALGQGERIPIENTNSGLAFTRQQTILYRLGRDQSDLSWSDRVLGQYGYRWICSIPLTTARGRLGILNLGGLDENPPTDAQVRFLEQLASHVALALERTLLVDELRSLNARLERENLVLQEEVRGEQNFEDIVGKSAALAHVLRQVEMVAETDATALILGESGTGKELVARAIHRLSPRKTKPFIKINCAAIPSGLLESELFGHEKGAFTGAIAQKIGRFELANGGSIFLDEVGEIPLELQSKLLRVLQEMEFERLGSVRTIRVNVRVIAATNRDLREMVRKGAFREDLYYRLHVFPVTIPPLRERREDIPLLVRYFVQQSSRRLGRQVTRIPDRMMEAMKAYSWPGNVRELENFIERAVILSKGASLQSPIIELGASDQTADATALTMEEAERRIILDALEACGWVIGGKHGAAARLAMKRTTLQSRMLKLGIQRPEQEGVGRKAPTSR